METASECFERCFALMQSADALERERGFQELRPRTAEAIHEILARFEDVRDPLLRDYLFILLLESDLPQAQPILRAVEQGQDERLRRLYAGFGRRDDLRPPVSEPRKDDGPILRLRRKVVTIAGFPVYVHLSLLIWVPLLLLGWSSWPVLGVLFASVLIHEFAHAFSCWFLGMGKGSITLWFYGGLFFPTRLTRMPHQMAWPERLRFVLMIAAGPMSNFTLATAAQLAWFFTDVEWLKQAADINLSLAFFNLLPMPPLDGEKIVVGLSQNWLSRRRVYVALSVLLVGSSILAFYGDIWLNWPSFVGRAAPYLVFGAIQAVRLALQTDSDLKKQEKAMVNAVAHERRFIDEKPETP